MTIDEMQIELNKLKIENRHLSERIEKIAKAYSKFMVEILMATGKANPFPPDDYYYIKIDSY